MTNNVKLAQEKMPRVVGTRLREARKRAGLTQRELGERVGTAFTQISMLETGNTTASLRNAARIARAISVSTDFLVGYADDPRRTDDIVEELELAQRRNGEHRAAVDPNVRRTREDVAILEVDAAAGPSALSSREHVIGHMRFAREWLRARNLVGDRCRVIRVPGESMEPTLPDQECILVDQSRNKRRDGKIFVVRHGNELLVKRTVEQSDGDWVLVSDNADKHAWPNMAWPTDAAVVGQVCWVGRTLL